VAWNIDIADGKNYCSGIGILVMLKL